MKNKNDYRASFMSDAQINFADELIDKYLVSWRDKDNRGLFDLWEKVESYWEGNPRIPTSYSDPNSNVNFIHPNVEGQVSLLVNQDINLNVIPVTPADKAFAQRTKTMLTWVKEKNRLTRKIDQHERRREKFGTGIFRVLYDPDAANGFGLPIIESVNPAYVFVDSAISDVYRIQQGSYIIEALTKPISWAKEQFGQVLGSSIRPSFDPTGSYLFDNNGSNQYLHLMVWLRTDGKLRLVQLSGDGIILSDSFADNNGESFYPTDQFPYFFTPLYIREGTVWAKGDAELLLALQDLVDELDDQIRVNARLSGNPQRLVDVSSNIDLDKWTNESGLIIPTSNINGARYLNPPEMPSYPLARREYAMNYERQIITRFADQMTGTPVSSNITATEAQGLLDQGSMVINHKIALLQETLSEVFDYCLMLMKEYYTEEKAYRLSDGEFEYWKASDLKNIPTANLETKEAEFDIIVKIGNETKDEAAMQGDDADA